MGYEVWVGFEGEESWRYGERKVSLFVRMRVGVGRGSGLALRCVHQVVAALISALAREAAAPTTGGRIQCEISRDPYKRKPTLGDLMPRQCEAAELVGR